MATIATFALKAGVWFRRGRLLIVSPDSLGTACPLSGRNSTYRPVQILEASSLFGSLVLATLIGTPTAHAVCTSPKNICKHIDDCLQRTSRPDNKDAERIREGVRTRDGKMVLAAPEPSPRPLPNKTPYA